MTSTWFNSDSQHGKEESNVGEKGESEENGVGAKDRAAEGNAVEDDFAEEGNAGEKVRLDKTETR